MDQTEAITQLLTEIRDLQREALTESRRINQEYTELLRATSERTDTQYAASVEQYKKAEKASHSFTWALYILIALSLGAYVLILVQTSGSR